MYVLTTPVRDEIGQIPALLATLDAQTAPPAAWVVVDDGSTDGSRQALEAAAAKRPWMHVVSAPEAATEYLGAHVARVKRWGLERAREHASDVLAAGVLDADLQLPPDHYARLLAALEADPGLGIVSSAVASPGEGGTTTERLQREDLPRGGTQFFRLTCLDAIDGLPPYPGFDGAANVKAMARGWRCRLIADVVATQARPTAERFGAAQGYARKGRYAWFLGHHPLLVLGRAAAFSAHAPHAAGLHFLRGWAGEALRGAPRCPDPEIRAHYGHERLRQSLKAVLGRGPGFVRR